MKPNIDDFELLEPELMKIVALTPCYSPDGRFLHEGESVYAVVVRKGKRVLCAREPGVPRGCCLYISPISKLDEFRLASPLEQLCIMGDDE